MRMHDIKEQRIRKLSTSVTVTCQAEKDPGSSRFDASITDNDPARTTSDQSNDIDTEKSIEKKTTIKAYQYVYKQAGADLYGPAPSLAYGMRLQGQ